jgi:phosphoenolpyruvate synthase/pyruvate phosphate dikinase
MKLFLGLNGEPIVDRVSSRFAGVGLIRGEYLCRQAGSYITDPKCQQLLATYVARVADLFAPDPVWYRFIEMESSEINLLPGADRLVEEKTTMLGLRGVRRGLRYRDTFGTEAEVITSVAASRRNLHALVPFIHDPTELESVQTMLSGLGFRNLRDFLSLGVANVTVGLNDLTSLTLGAYRGSGYDDPMHPAVRRLLAIAREATAGREVLLAAAGYLSPAMIDVCEGLGYDAAVVHYSKLPEVLGDSFAMLPGRLDLDAIKRDVRTRVGARARRAAPAAADE